MVNFGAVLKQLRMQADMTQKQLAEKLDITKSVVSYYETSDRAPSAEMLVKIANVFHVTTDLLLGLRDAGKTINTDGLLEEDVDLMNSVIAALQKKNRNERDCRAKRETSTNAVHKINQIRTGLW